MLESAAGSTAEQTPAEEDDVALQTRSDKGNSPQQTLSEKEPASSQPGAVETPSDDERFPSLHQAANTIQQKGYRPTWYQNRSRLSGRQQPLSPLPMSALVPAFPSSLTASYAAVAGLPTKRCQPAATTHFQALGSTGIGNANRQQDNPARPEQTVRTPPVTGEPAFLLNVEPPESSQPTTEDPVVEPPVQPESSKPAAENPAPEQPRQTMPEEEYTLGDDPLGNITNKATSVKKSLNVDSPSFTPAQLQPGGKKSSFSSQAANAVPFTPKAAPNGTLIFPRPVFPITGRSSRVSSTALAQEAESSIFNPATIREFTPQSQNYELGTPAATNGGSAETTGYPDPFNLSTMTQSLAPSQFNPYAEEHSMAGASAPFYTAQAAYQAPAQPLQYHQYAPVGPHRSDMASYQRQAHDFFIPTEIREDMQKKSEATRQVLPSMHLPTVAQYHTLVPLDVRTSGGSIRECKSWTYKAVSKKTGNTYCLRRLTNVQSVTRESVTVIARWKRINCANVVSVIECFTSRDFSDMSLIFVHNYHPLSKTLAEHHFPSTTQNSRFPRTTTVAENVLWSYICQFCNALKAIHAEGLAARCIELSKVILTDKNRIRLSACAIVDVLEYESKRPI